MFKDLNKTTSKDFKENLTQKKTTNENTERKNKERGWPGGLLVKNLPCNAKDTGSIPGPQRSHMPQSN